MTRRGGRNDIEVIAGSPTARKIAAGRAKATGRAGEKSAQAGLVDTHVGRIRTKVDEGAGPFGDVPRYRHGRRGNAGYPRHQGA